jgi:hypothetical protein
MTANDNNSEEIVCYLVRVYGQLKGCPLDWRDEQIEEIRQHLKLLINDQLACGLSPRDASLAAFQKLGDPVMIGRRLRGQWIKDRWAPFHLHISMSMVKGGALFGFGMMFFSPGDLSRLWPCCFYDFRCWTLRIFGLIALAIWFGVVRKVVKPGHALGSLLLCELLWSVIAIHFVLPDQTVLAKCSHFLFMSFREQLMFQFIALVYFFLVNPRRVQI